MNQPLDPGDRTYYVSDERLRTFRQLTPEQWLRWVEEPAAFLRMVACAGMQNTLRQSCHPDRTS